MKADLLTQKKEDIVVPPSLLKMHVLITWYDLVYIQLYHQHIIIGIYKIINIRRLVVWYRQ